MKTINKSTGYFIKVLLLGFGVIPFAVSLLCLIPFLMGMGGLNDAPFLIILTAIFSIAAFLTIHFGLRECPESFVMRYLPVCLPLFITLAAWAVCMVISKGFYGHRVFVALALVEIAFLPITFFMSFMGKTELIFFVPLIYNLMFLLIYTLEERKTINKPLLSKKFILACLSLVLIFGATGGAIAFSRSRTILPKNYGFRYGGGYASVDIYRYNVINSDNILAILDSPSSFTISDKNKMPVLDGAEAAYPVYSAFANACYESIANNPYALTDKLTAEDKPAARKEDYSLSDEKITFTNTIYAFERLVNGEVDIFFGAQPSKEQEELAYNAGKKLVLTPIAKEAFVFFVSNTNVCDNLTTQNIHDIYSGKVKNWVSLNSMDEKIFAFQRPENSGSQTIMQKIMGDVPLAAPLREEYVAGMGGVSESVANYRNYPGAIGYSFRFFTTGMAGSSDEIKLLSINGIAPTTENIANDLYPYTVSLYAITLEDNTLDTIKPFLEWMQGAEGQELIQKTGYVMYKQ